MTSCLPSDFKIAAAIVKVAVRNKGKDILIDKFIDVVIEELDCDENSQQLREKLKDLVPLRIAALNKTYPKDKKISLIESLSVKQISSVISKKSIGSIKLPTIDQLSACLTRAVSYYGFTFDTKNWPDGVIFVPDFLSTETIKSLLKETDKFSGENSVIIRNIKETALFQCLSDVLIEMKFIPQISRIIIDKYGPGKGPSSQKDEKSNTVILCLEGLILVRFEKESMYSFVPLFSGSCLIIDKKVFSEWRLSISDNKNDHYLSLSGKDIFISQQSRTSLTFI